MTDPSSSSNRASAVVPGPASPSAKTALPRPRPQPAPVTSDSTAPSRQRSSSIASTSSSRQQQVRRQPSREGAPSSSQQAQTSPAQRPTSSSSMRPSSLQSGHNSLAPLYTLVTNATSDTAYHPRVHYIFNDDDENEALAQALNHAAHRQQQHHQNHRGQPGGGSEDSLAHGNRDRAILLDLDVSAADGWKVKQASSLSSDWAVVSAQVTRLQEDDGGAAGQDEDGQQSLMLRIEGVDGAGHSPHLHIGDVASLDGSRGSVGRPSSSPALEYDAVLEEFDKKMGTLRQVVEAGDEKRRGEEAKGRAELGVVEEESTEGER